MKIELHRERITIFVSLIAATLFGAYLRLRNITEDSLWLDELFSVAVSQPDNSFSYVFQRTLNDVHPPFFQIVLWGFYKVFGFGEMAGRYLSAAFGIMLIPAMFVLGRQTFDVRVGLYAAWLAAINFYLIVYSQEIRSYELLVLLTTVSFVAFVRVMRTLHGVDMFVYSVVAAMLVSTHYFGFLVVFAQALLVLIGVFELPWDRRRLYRFGLAGLFILLCLSPQLSYVISNLHRKDFWVPAPSDSFFVDLFVLYFGNQSLAVLAAALLIVVVTKGLRGNGAAVGLNVLGVWVVVCIAVPYLRSIYVQPVLTMRNLIILLPAVLVLMGFGVSLFKGRWARIGVGLLIVSFSMTPLFTQFKPVPTEANQLKPISQIRDVLEELIKKPEPWPVYSSQFLEFGVYLRLLGSSSIVKSHDQLVCDLVSDEQPAKFYYLFRNGAIPPNKDFMTKYGVRLLEEKRIGDSAILKFQSLALPIDPPPHS